MNLTVYLEAMALNVDSIFGTVGVPSFQVFTHFLQAGSTWPLVRVLSRSKVKEETESLR